MKKIIVVGLIVMTMVTLTGCGCKKKEEKKPTETEGKETLNTNKGIIKEKEIEGIKFTNAILLMDGEGMSSYKISLVNKTGKPKTIDTFKVTFKGKSGEVLLETYGYVGYELKNEETAEVMISLDQDMRKAYEVDYEFTK